MRTLGARGYWLRHLKEEGVARMEQRSNYLYRADDLTPLGRAGGPIGG
jgi:hypothetical protein